MRVGSDMVGEIGEGGGMEMQGLDVCVCVCVCVYVSVGGIWRRKGETHRDRGVCITYMIRPLCRVDGAASIPIGEGDVKIEHAIERCSLSLTEVGAHDAAF